MATKFKWDKINREARRDYTPSWRTLAATNRQLDFLRVLQAKKGQRGSLPKTKHGASEMIDRLMDLPDIEGQIQERKEVEKQRRVEREKDPLPFFEQELQTRYQISPQQSQALVYLCQQADSAGYSFFFEELFNETVSLDGDNDDIIAKLMGLFARWREGTV